MVKKMLIAAFAATFALSVYPALAGSQPVAVKIQARALDGIAASMKEEGAPRRGEGIIMREKKTEKTITPEQNFSRSRQFIHRFYTPENVSDELVILLHGSGGNETSLVPMASKVWPRATLLGIRGRVLQDGGTRWYKRITAVKFDQKDVKLEANAFVTFLTRLADQKDLDLTNATFVGYSNGANLLGATMVLHPDLVKRAVLMRSMPVLDDAPTANLGKAKVLTISGESDKLYSPFAPALSSLLRNSGAQVDARMIKADHMLGDTDVSTLKEWVAATGAKTPPDVTMKRP